MLDITRGRAFCLFTSYPQMRDLYERLLPELDYPCLLQGTAPRKALLEEFRNTPNAVLFGTSSFWQGVDVQGEALSCVIVDRLPFSVPTDPVVSARMRAVEDDGASPFFEYQVPAAVITLKQGFGRLIRSLEDRGVLVLLDPRIERQRYRQGFPGEPAALPLTRDIGEVESFFARSKRLSLSRPASIERAMSRNLYILAASLLLFSLVSCAMLVPDCHQPGLPGNGSLWKTTGLFLFWRR